MADAIKFRNSFRDRKLEILIAALREYIDRGNHSKNDIYEAAKLLAKAKYAKCLRYP